MMKSKKLLLVLFAVQLLLCLSLSVFAADDVHLAFRFNATTAESPDSVVQAGDTFDVKVYIPVNKGVTYVKAYLYYDPAAVALAENPFDYTGSAFPTVEVKDPGTSTGGKRELTIYIGNLADVTAALLGGGTPPVYDGTGLVATIKFVALAESVVDNRTTSIELKCTGGNTSDANLGSLTNNQISTDTLNVRVIGSNHVHTGGTATCTDKKICEICTAEYGELAEHVFATELTHNETEHWFACTNPECTEVKDKAPHDFGTEYTPAEGGHTQSCACGYVTPVEAHTGGTATCMVQANCEKCGTAYGELSTEHVWSETFESDETNHWHTCTVEDCTATSEKLPHKGGTASCTEQAKCEDCNAAYGELAEHTPTDLKFDSTNHWYKCANCDYTANQEAHVLKNAEVKNEVPATCWGKGSYVQVSRCACGYETSEIVAVPATGNHNWAAATCTAPKTCQNEGCGATEGDVAAHTWVAATCTTPKTCSVCKATEGDVAAHTWVAATCTTAKTCSVCKATEGTAAGHKWTDADCTTPKTCSVCKVTEGNALGHKWTDATCTTAKTCSVCKVTEGEALGHKWTDATCTTPKTCSVCQETEGEALGHKWVDATCTTPKTCSVCSETEGTAAGHKWTDATCTTAKTCSVCSATDGEALGHDWAAATCTAPKTCKRCDATEGEKLAHTFGEWETTKEPTTKEEGEDTRKCTNCDATETRPIEMKADYTWLIVAVVLVLAAAGIVVVVVLKKKRK